MYNNQTYSELNYKDYLHTLTKIGRKYTYVDYVTSNHLRHSLLGNNESNAVMKKDEQENLTALLMKHEVMNMMSKKVNDMDSMINFIKTINTCDVEAEDECDFKKNALYKYNEKIAGFLSHEQPQHIVANE